MDIDNSLSQEKQEEQIIQRNQPEVQYGQKMDKCQDQKIRGEVTEFVPKQEVLWRATSIYENPPFKIVSEYLRNGNYKPQTVRTPDTLKQCTRYLIETILPLIGNKQYKTQETIQFISNRMKAIRSEYYVQSYTDTEVLQIMLKYQCIASAYTHTLTEIIVVVKTLYEKYKQQPKLSKLQYLKYIFIVCSFTREFDQIILLFDTLFPEFNQFTQYTRLCASLKNNQYYYYFQYLKKCQFCEACILTPSLKDMRYNAIRAFAVSQLVLDLDYLTDYLLMDDSKSTLDLLSKIGYDVSQYQISLQRNQKVQISMKMKLKDMKELVAPAKGIPKRILQKRNDKSEKEIILSE